MMTGCSEMPEAIPDVREPVSTVKSRAGAREGTMLPNPYEIEVMQQAYDSLAGGHTVLAPTDLYVRFLPSGMPQLNALRESLHLELFDYPLEYYSEDESVIYRDTTLAEGAIPWQYTTVKPDFIFPDSIRHEIISECFIPDEEEIKAQGGSNPLSRSGDSGEFAAALENLAFDLAGFPLPSEEGPQTRSALSLERPQGTIRVWDTYLQQCVAVKGVKVRCNILVKYSTAFTNEWGYYSMDSKFRFRTHYAIVYDNAHNFDIWGNFGPIARANYDLGWHEKTGYSCDIYPYNSGAWYWSTVNNAAYDYYQMCENTCIPKPPSSLKIWVSQLWNNWGEGGGAAPMLRRIKHLIPASEEDAWAGSNLAALVDQINGHPILKLVCPDVTIAKVASVFNTRDLYYLVNHELSHASHYTAVRSEYWAKYVHHIISYDGYGSETDQGPYKGYCAIGEMWAYAMGHIQENEKYYPLKVDRTYDFYFNDSYWMKPQIFWDLYRDKILTKKQIYDCLISSVHDYAKLISQMYEKYPAKANEIEAAFIRHGVNLGIPKPVIDPPPFYPPSPPLSIWALFSSSCSLGKGSIVKFEASSSGLCRDFIWSGYPSEEFIIIPLSGIQTQAMDKPLPGNFPESVQWFKFTQTGAFVVRCRATKGLNRIEEAQIFITVDNSPPLIMPGMPAAGEILTVPCEWLICE